MRTRVVIRSVMRVAPGIAALCVLLFGVSEALAARVPQTCRPEIRYNQPTGHYLLYSSTCPSSVKCMEGEVEHPCDSWTVPDGINAGAKGCACPTADMEHSCILIYRRTGDKEGVGQSEYDIVNADCEDMCDGPCTLTSTGGPSP